MMTEQTTIDYINSQTDCELVLTSSEDKFKDYDAEDARYIVEIKNRNKSYITYLIEGLKLFKNLKAAEIKNKQFLFVITTPTKLYVWNMTKLTREVLCRIEPKELLMPASTEFKNRNKVLVWFWELRISWSKKFKL